MTDEHETFEIHLSAPQLRKFKAGKPFQLNSSQLSTGTTGEKVELTMHRKHYRRMLTNIKNRKGFRFNDSNIHGGRLWDKVKHVWNTIKEHGAKAIDFIKNNVPKETLQNLAEVGINELAPKKIKGLAKRVAKKAVDYGYDAEAKGGLEHAVDLSKSLAPEIKQGIRMAVPKKHKKVANKIINALTPVAPAVDDIVPADVPPVVGSGLKRFVKGSAEAKAWGEKMKALRQQKKGKGLGNVLLKVASPLLPSIGKALGGLAGKAVGGENGEAIGSTIGDIVGKVSGARVSGRGVRHNKVPYGQLVSGVPNPVITEASAERIKTHGLHHRHHGKNGLYKGGSFLSP